MNHYFVVISNAIDRKDRTVIVAGYNFSQVEDQVVLNENEYIHQIELEEQL